MKAFRVIAPALYEVQPGDGTRYLVAVHGPLVDGSIYVSAGAGDAIQGGYWLTRQRVLGAVWEACAGVATDDQERMRPLLDYAEYWRAHCPGVHNVCTARVALWAASVALSAAEHEQEALMTAYSHGVYYHDRAKFMALIRTTHLAGAVMVEDAE